MGRTRHTLQCASQVVETVPAIMRLIRMGMRGAGADLSVSQVRVLAYLNRKPGACVSEVGEELDVTIASASVLVDRLVRRKLVRREDDHQERRRVRLMLTASGQQSLADVREHVQAFIAGILNTGEPEHLERISDGLELLQKAAKSFGTNKTRIGAASAAELEQ